MITMEFPRLPYNANRNRKIMDYDDANIKRLYSEGKTIAYLARFYGVRWETIKKHVDEQYRQRMVKRAVEAHKIWYANLSKKEKKELWRYASKDLMENARRFKPQMDYVNAINAQNHRKPQNYEKRMRRQRVYVQKPQIKEKILARARQAYKQNPDRQEYHRQWNEDWKATHERVGQHWVLTDGLKWRILREMVIR